MRTIKTLSCCAVLLAGLLATAAPADADLPSGGGAGAEIDGDSLVVGVNGKTYRVPLTKTGKPAGAFPAITCGFSIAAGLGGSGAVTTAELQGIWEANGNRPVSVYRICSDGSSTEQLWAPGVAVPRITGADLAERAASQLPIPKPQILTSPESIDDGGNQPQLVNWPMFVAMQNWATHSTTASAGGITATATLTPVQIIIDSHSPDGQTTCTNSGKDWPDRTKPTLEIQERFAMESSCSFRFTYSSGLNAPEGSPVVPDGTVITNWLDHKRDWGGKRMWPVTFTAVWHTTWRATDGTSGDLGFTTSRTTKPQLVVEAQAVNIPVGEPRPDNLDQ